MRKANIIKYALPTEKAMRLMESENKLVFVVDNNATKAQIRKEIEQDFGVKIIKINTHIVNGSEKRAYIKFAADTPAIDIATKLGMM